MCLVCSHLPPPSPLSSATIIGTRVQEANLAGTPCRRGVGVGVGARTRLLQPWPPLAHACLHPLPVFFCGFDSCLGRSSYVPPQHSLRIFSVLTAFVFTQHKQHARESPLRAYASFVVVHAYFGYSSRYIGIARFSLYASTTIYNRCLLEPTFSAVTARCVHLFSHNASNSFDNCNTILS